MAKMLNYRFRYKVTALFRATVLLWICGFLHTHEKGRPTVSSCHTIPYFTCEQWSACPALCIISAGSPFLSKESLDPAKCFLHLWTQLWATGCSVPNTVCWRQLELYSAGFFFFFLFSACKHFSKPFCWLLGCSIPRKKRKSFVTYKTWKWEFQWAVGSGASKILFAGFFWPPSRP